MIEYVLHEGNRARRERQVWRSGVGFLLLSVILNTHISTFVRSRTGDANRSASTRRWRSIHGRRRRSRDHRSRHSPLARDRASGVRFATTEPVRFGSFFCFRGASVFATDRRTDGARDRSKKGLRRESSINSFWGLSSRPIDSIRSDPIRPDRSRPRFAPSVVEPRRAWVSPRRGE